MPRDLQRSPRIPRDLQRFLEILKEREAAKKMKYLDVIYSSQREGSKKNENCPPLSKAPKSSKSSFGAFGALKSSFEASPRL
jgi:hypothetical protein